MLCFEPLSLDIAFSLVMCFSFSPVVFFPPFFLFTNTWLYLLVSWYSQNIERKYTMTQIFFPLRLTAITDSNLPVTASQVHFLVNQNSKVCSWHQQGVSTTNMLTTKQNWTEMRFIKCLLLAFRARLRDKYVSDNSRSHHSCMTHTMWVFCRHPRKRNLSLKEVWTRLLHRTWG